MNNLKVTNLKYKYGKTEALKGISFEVNEGLIGILGPNGAGKTTAMKLITTLFSLQEGEIYLNDMEYTKNLKEVRRSLGYLPQDFTTYGNLKGREFLEIIASLKLDSNKKKISSHVDEIVEKLNMNEYIDRKVKEYSGGMKQKLGFAQVLTGDPNLIVVDEPTVGLDPEQRNTIRELFPVISKNRIVLATTHIVEDIEYYCSYLLVIKDGKLIYSGTKENFIKEIEGTLWEADMDAETYIKVREKNIVITTLQNKDYFHIKYISNEALTNNSVCAKVNLQDAYIAHSNRAQKVNSYD
ncbi:ATP-binding cassette domain-containing protein [Candidatus Clostridium radicumherbarum]|uniref:ATP-binding cassette domain-containing protein n=1 Tax=Candidatus Clostridium radicumherbarum TaxID=3381662 RepID=A0ABW8TPC4_9CLOT